MNAPFEQNLKTHRDSKLRRAYVPETLLLGSSGLSPEARIVAMYIFSRPATWHLCLNQVRLACGLKDATWRRVSKELRRSGHIRQTKVRTAGKYLWRFEAFETPAMQEAASTMRRIPTDGSTTVGTTACGLPPERGKSRSKVVSIAGRKRPPDIPASVSGAAVRPAGAATGRDIAEESHRGYYAAFGLLGQEGGTDVVG